MDAKTKGSILNDDNPPTSALAGSTWNSITSTYDRSDINRAIV